MARVLIVRPPIDKQPGQLVLSGIPLGSLALASWLRMERGDDVRVLDYHLDSNRLDQFSEHIREFDPDVLGFSAYSIQGPLVHSLVEHVKTVRPHCTVVVGGPYARASQLHILDNCSADYVVVGDGERPFQELIDRIESGESVDGTAGIAYRDKAGNARWDGRLGENQDLDELPLPAYDTVDMEAYFNRRTTTYWEAHQRRVPILTTRGCVFQCAYCFHMYGSNFRRQSTERVMREIGHLVENYGVRELQFFDDCFNVGRESALDILDAISSSRWNLRLSFPPGLRGDLLDRELISAMKRAGAYQLCIPIDTITPRHNQYVNRQISLRKIGETIAMADKAGLITVTNIIFGFPGETRREMENTIKYVKSTKAHLATFVMLNVFEGTDLYRKIKRDYPDYELTPYVGDWQSTRFNMSELSGDELLAMCSQATLRFHLSLWRLWRIIILLPRKRAFLELINLFVRRVFRRILFSRTPPPQC
ncbi:B12-binding domain-containing radical SAM protein [Thermodesulfobacteriota bacterium]